MTSRRIVGGEKTLLEKDDTDSRTPAASEKSIIAPAVPTHVIMKLLGFTFAMVVFPIGTYFLIISFMPKSSTLAGAVAAIMANVVLIGYIIVAMTEDQSEQEEEKKRH